MAGRFRTVHGGPGRLGVLREAIDRDNAVARMHGQVRGVPKAVPGVRGGCGTDGKNDGNFALGFRLLHVHLFG